MVQIVPRFLLQKQSFWQVLQNREKKYKYITLLKRLLNKNQKRIGKLHGNRGRKKRNKEKECFS